MFSFYFWERERETEREQGRGRERGRHRIWRRFQALRCEHRAWCVARMHEPWDQDLSQSQMRNRLSHPGTPAFCNLGRDPNDHQKARKGKHLVKQYKWLKKFLSLKRLALYVSCLVLSKLPLFYLEFLSISLKSLRRWPYFRGHLLV